MINREEFKNYNLEQLKNILEIVKNVEVGDSGDKKIIIIHFVPDKNEHVNIHRRTERNYFEIFVTGILNRIVKIFDHLEQPKCKINYIKGFEMLVKLEEMRKVINNTLSDMSIDLKKIAKNNIIKSLTESKTDNSVEYPCIFADVYNEFEHNWYLNPLMNWYPFGGSNHKFGTVMENIYFIKL